MTSDDIADEIRPVREEPGVVRNMALTLLVILAGLGCLYILIGG